MFGLDIGYISGVESMQVIFAFFRLQSWIACNRPLLFILAKFQSFRDDVNNGCELDEWQLGFVTSVLSIYLSISLRMCVRVLYMLRMCTKICVYMRVRNSCTTLYCTRHPPYRWIRIAGVFRRGDRGILLSARQLAA